MEERERLCGMIENILFAAGDSVAIGDIAAAIGKTEAETDELLAFDEARRRDRGGLIIKRFEGARVQLATSPSCAEMLSTMFGIKNEEQITRAMMEILAIVAYKQPVTRGEIEELRGVNSSYLLGVLLNKRLICEAGRKDAVGRPILYATSEDFLRHFGIGSVSELPPLPEE